MKLTILLLFAGMIAGLASEAYSQTTRLDLVFKDLTIESALKSIEEQTEFRFFYNGKIDVDRKIDLHFEQKSIAEILDAIFKNTDVKHNIDGRIIVLSNEDIALIGSSSQLAQPTAITGTVTDNNNAPIPGVTIMVKGTSKGTITDGSGNYLINAKTGDVLVFSFVGMKSQEVAVTKPVINIMLDEESIGLDEVVAIGYGSMVRRELTGSVGSVSGVALERIPVASAAEALQGKVAGVQVTTIDGAPGSEVNIRIRGGTSVTQSNSPLFIVDGFPADNINDIPPTDIQSIDILKDASLTAIYGARGGNGVVIVTTKSARVGKLTVNFNHTSQVRTLARKIELMNPYEFIKIQYDAVVTNNTRRQQFRGNFGNPADFSLYKRFKGNDWQDEILGGNPMSYMYNMTIGGGTQGLRFNTSITHNDERGVLIGSGVIRTNVNTKINADISKKVKVLINPRFNYRQDRGAGADAVGSGGIIDVLRYRPTNGLRDFSYLPPEDIDPEEERYFQYTNPKGDINQNYLRGNRYEFTNQALIEWNVIPGLIFRTEGSQYMAFYYTDRFWGDLTSTARNNNSLPVAELVSQRRNRYGWTNTLNYNLSQNNHNYSFLLGQEIQSSVQFASTNSARYFPKEIEPEIAIRNMGLGTPWKVTSSISSPERAASFFGQANYNYAQKYLLSATFRADASTKFAPGNQWGYFPAISGAWILSKENFMADQNLFSLLKLRVAIGKAGNNRITDDMWRYQYVVSTSGGPGWGEINENGYEYYVNSGGSTFPNPKIKWETTLTRNFAFDIGMFKDRLTITPEVYWNTTSDLLYESNIPSTSGYARQMQNIGQVTNRGFDLTVDARIIESQNAYLNANFTFGANKTRIDKLNGTEDVIWTTSKRWSSSDFDYCLKVGDQLGLIYGYVYDGIYRFNEFEMTSGYSYVALPETVNNDALFGTAPGRPKFKNFVDGVDGASDINIVNENDKVVIGNTNPKFSGGFGLSAGWQNFDFSANFNFIYGFDVNNASRYTLSSFENNTNNYFNILPEFNEDRRWRYAEDTYGDRMVNDSRYVDLYREINADAVVFNPVDIGKKVTHSYFIEDGSFLRLQDLTLGYSLPKKVLDSIGLTRLRVFFSGYNLWIWTNYSGYDPEVDIQSGLTPSVDYNRYPRSRNYVFGVNVTL
ncbi:TonB-dependent receptor [Gaoshiqia sp. Z1-71]|uniref:TonB-dependent receptor n=1 Tax=Gaoshiqia hydrogeniformans TaxID=3290090 RepID=UPI003BF7EF3E